MKTIELPCFGIVIQIGDDGSSIESELHDEAQDVLRDGGDGNFFDDVRIERQKDAELYSSAMDGIESLILAHAAAGIDVESPAYIEGIETAVEAAGNNI